MHGHKPRPAWCCCPRCGSVRFVVQRGRRGQGMQAVCGRGHATAKFYDRLRRAGAVDVYGRKR